MPRKRIRFCKHAEAKFKILREHGFSVTKGQVVDVVKNADKMEKGEKSRIIFQKAINDEHVLRVVCERKDGILTVITFYPGRRKYYEN